MNILAEINAFLDKPGNEIRNKTVFMKSSYDSYSNTSVSVSKLSYFNTFPAKVNVTSCSQRNVVRTL